MKQVLFIVGSLREGSFNKQLAREAKKLISSKVQVSYLDYRDVPMINQDIEFPAPAAVQQLRDTVAQADAIWIFSPEYNYSYPGPLKNVIDWLSRPTVPGDYSTTTIAGKLVTISNVAGRSAGANCRAKLTDLLKMVRAQVLEEPHTGVVLSSEAFVTGHYDFTESDLAQLQSQAHSLLTTL